jgi:hypothetical protein
VTPESAVIFTDLGLVEGFYWGHFDYCGRTFYTRIEASLAHMYMGGAGVLRLREDLRALKENGVPQGARIFSAAGDDLGAVEYDKIKVEPLTPDEITKLRLLLPILMNLAA